MFFAVFGLRAAFTIPTELDANWVFRLVQPTVRDSVRASRWLTLMLGVVPISLVWLLVSLALWPAPTAVGATFLTLATGMMLTEVALGNWTKIPFASAHEPATETLKSKWAWYIGGLLMYQFLIPVLQLTALQSWITTLTHVGTLVGLVVAVRIWRAHTLRTRTPTFDVANSDAITLNLSEAAS
jgi:bacteriorhodopsin